MVSVPSVSRSCQGSRGLTRAGLILQSAENMVRQVVADLAMPRHGLACTGPWILIPIVPPPTSKQDAPILFKAPNQVGPFHAIRSSATRRTPGIRPLVSSS
jgi:hypothetical protein